MDSEPYISMLAKSWKFWTLIGLIAVGYVVWIFKMSAWADFFDRIRGRFPRVIGLLIGLAILLIMEVVGVPIMPRPR